MLTIPIAFQFVSGRHTAANIKLAYENTCREFKCEKKEFKIVCDHAANMVKAFESTFEAKLNDHSSD